MNQQLVDDLKAVLLQAEELLETTTGSSSQKLDAARKRLSKAMDALEVKRAQLQNKATDAARATARMVKEHPYETAAGGSLLLLAAVVGGLWWWQRSR